MKVLVVAITKDTLNPRCQDSIIRQLDAYRDSDLLIHVSRPKYDMGDDKKMVGLYRNCSENRNAARLAALGTKADYFLFVDSDVVLPVDALECLTLWEKPVIGGYYLVNETTYAAGIFLKQNSEAKDADIFMRYGNPVNPGLVGADMVGLGCALVRRDVLEKVQFRHGCNEFCKAGSLEKPFVMPFGECIAFGLDCKKAGFNLFMDGRVICEHLK